MHTILGHFDLDFDFWPHFKGLTCLEHIFYITANFPQMCLILDQVLGGIRHVTVTLFVFVFSKFKKHSPQIMIMYDRLSKRR